MSVQTSYAPQGCDVPTRQKHVVETMGRLSHKVENVEHHVALLMERLCPVMRDKNTQPCTLSGNECKVAQDEIMMTPLAAEIQYVNDRLMAVYEKLNDIVERLEV